MLKGFRKITCLSAFTICLAWGTNAQILGGFEVYDYLVAATHPYDCSPNFVTGPPSDSIWVNFNGNETDVMNGSFGGEWVNGPGSDLLLETGFHADNYDVRLLLTNGFYSSTVFVDEISWVQIEDIDWQWMQTNCNEADYGNHLHYVYPLDFDEDFGLASTDTVQGIEITFLYTEGLADLAGVYIVAGQCKNTSSNLEVASCESYISPSGDYTWEESGIYEDVIPNAMGCDSIITVDLTVNAPTFSTDSQSTCDSYTWIDGNTYSSANPNGTHIIENSVGCDSIITLDLTFLSETFGTDIQNSCDSLTWINGQTYFESNSTATDTLVNAMGCDSIVTLDLTITTLDTMITSDGNVLIADQVGGSYQWLSCPDMTPIIGATDQSFEVVESGEYAVVITNEECLDTTSCHLILITDLEENNSLTGSFLFPNPGNGEFSIDLGQVKDKVTITISDLRGKIIRSERCVGGQIKKLIVNEAKGTYLLVVTTESERVTKRLVIE
jgi:hypothetical protein